MNIKTWAERDGKTTKTTTLRLCELAQSTNSAVKHQS
jgi:hypothetical protein